MYRRERGRGERDCADSLRFDVKSRTAASAAVFAVLCLEDNANILYESSPPRVIGVRTEILHWMPYCRRNDLRTTDLFRFPEPSDRWGRRLICVNAWYAARTYCFQRRQLAASGAASRPDDRQAISGFACARQACAQAGGPCDGTRSQASHEDAHEVAWRYLQTAGALNPRRQPCNLPARKTDACIGARWSGHRRTA